MSEFKSLLRLLQKEVGYQEKLLKLLTSERVAIVKLNQEQIEEVRKEKEKLVADAIDVEASRCLLMENLSQSLSGEMPENEQPRFRELIEQCADFELKETLSKQGQDLNTVAKTVKKLNDENASLIKQSLGLIATTIAIMQSAPGTDLPIYGQSGKLTSDSQDPAFSKPRSSVRRSV